MSRKEDFVSLELLARSNLLQNIDRDALQGLMAAGKRLRAAARDVVVNRAEPGSDIYFLLAGGVKISTLSPEGKEAIFDVLVAGDYFGEISLLDGKPRTGTVTALVASDFLMVGKTVFLDFLKAFPVVSIRLATTLATRLRMMDALVEDVMFLDAEARLAKRVMALSRIFGRQGKDGAITIDLKMSQQDMANLVGITRESVNKHFRGWERSGAIGMDNGRIIVREPHLLESLVGN